MEHTPTPWEVQSPLGDWWIVQAGLPSYEWTCIASVRADDSEDAMDRGSSRPISSAAAKANAALIVRAVNAHDDLVGALRFILAFYEPGQTHLDTEAWKQAEAGARRALAKATA